MILVDASVIIDFWKSHREEYADVLRQPGVHMCGVTLAELMHGALNQQDCDDIERKVGRFIRLGIRDEDWAALGRNLYALRKAGIQVSFPDAILATVAVGHDMELWTLDGHFQDMQEVLKDLRLYQGPAGI